MSVRVMALVWDKFPAGGTDLLAMLAMADWGNDHGASIHPWERSPANSAPRLHKHAE